MKRILLGIGLFISILNSHAIDLSGSIFSHDPATITKDGNTYWHMYTAPGIGFASSTNLTSWNFSSKHIFTAGPNWKTNYPAWTITYFGTTNTDGNLWAPDVIYMNGAYYLYYSCSSFGSSRSAIGLVVSPSLNSPDWIDYGMVVSSSGLSTDINAIDPGLFRDTDGKIYMTYGSWFGGIGIVEIDSVTGLATTSVTHVYGGGHQSIEASYIFKKDSYYYLVVNRGTCCNGTSSTYYITVGRSTNIYGPYDGWRTILAASGKYYGPGHFALMHKGCHDYISIHYYDGNDHGYSKLDILKMTMEDGWPVLTRDFSFSDPCPTGISNLKARDDDEVQIYPNPALNSRFSMNLMFPCNANDVDVSIYSMDGRQVYNETFSYSETLEVNPELKSGIYLVKVAQDKETYFKKLSVYNSN
ncbi:MAG: family 43 glycosylhydrolase [Bacteroidales bacterium]|nr:family 43 glycosylhydrolase [Bacteroidales bacterium]